MGIVCLPCPVGKAFWWDNRQAIIPDEAGEQTLVLRQDGDPGAGDRRIGLALNDNPSCCPLCFLVLPVAVEGFGGRGAPIGCEACARVAGYQVDFTAGA